MIDIKKFEDRGWIFVTKTDLSSMGDKENYYFKSPRLDQYINLWLSFHEASDQFLIEYEYIQALRVMKSEFFDHLNKAGEKDWEELIKPKIEKFTL